MSEHFGLQIKGIECPHCGTENEAEELTCFSCGQSLVIPTEKDTPTFKKIKSPIGLVLIPGLVIFLVCAVCISAQIFQTTTPSKSWLDDFNSTQTEISQPTPTPTPTPNREEIAIYFKSPSIPIDPDGSRTDRIRFNPDVNPIFPLEVWIDTKGREIKEIYITISVRGSIATDPLIVENIEAGELVAKEDFYFATPKNGLPFSYPDEYNHRNKEYESIKNYNFSGRDLAFSVKCVQLCFDGQEGSFNLAKIIFRPPQRTDKYTSGENSPPRTSITLDRFNTENGIRIIASSGERVEREKTPDGKATGLLVFEQYEKSD